MCEAEICCNIILGSTSQSPCDPDARGTRGLFESQAWLVIVWNVSLTAPFTSLSIASAVLTLALRKCRRRDTTQEPLRRNSPPISTRVLQLYKLMLIGNPLAFRCSI